MSLHLCSNCNQVESTWSMDDDGRTWWHCTSCEFVIEEDESKEKNCPTCNLPYPTMMWLFNESSAFYWCTSCGRRELEQTN